MPNTEATNRGRGFNHVRVYSEVKKDAWEHSIDRFNPWDLAREWYGYNISNGRLDGSVFYLLQHWQAEKLGLRYGPTISLVDGQAAVDHRYYLESGHERQAREMVEKNISAFAAGENLVITAGSETYSVPLQPDITTLQRVTDNVVRNYISAVK